MEQVTLQEVKLHGAQLTSGMLKKAHLDTVDLSDAYMRYADLEGASIRAVDFKNAVLKNINLRGAEMWYSNLEEAASLAFANMEGLTLEFAHPNSKVPAIIDKLRQAPSLKGVTLPDGTKLPGTDFVVSESEDNAWRKEFDRWCSA